MRRTPYTLQASLPFMTQSLSSLPDPQVDNIYSWSRFTPLNEVKVVILGQVGRSALCFH